MNPPYLRRFSVCVLLTAMTATATAQQTPTTAPAGTAPTAGALQTDPAPRVRNLKMAQRVQAPQGHARLLVGVRTLTSAKLVFQITAVKGNRLVKTIRSAELEPAGRVYVIVEATDQRGYQLPAGAYRVRAQATDASGRVSNSIIKGFRVAYDPPVGRLDGAIQPLWPALARSIGQAGQRGQLVAALEPGGALVKAGVRRGDVITSLAGQPTLSTGQFDHVIRGLPAGTPVNITVRRESGDQSFRVTLNPDWTSPKDLTRAFTVITRREPKSFAYAVSAARYLVKKGDAAAAQTMINAWPAAWRRSAVGQVVEAEYVAAAGNNKRALGAWSRAVTRDRRFADARFGRARTLDALGKDVYAARDYSRAFALDPKRAAAAAFQAFALFRAGRDSAALLPAISAEKTDATSPVAKIAAGIALIRNKNRARGVQKLRQGLEIYDDTTAGQAIIDEYLEKADP